MIYEDSSVLLESGQAPRLASYDRRMLDIAQALGWPLAALENSP